MLGRGTFVITIIIISVLLIVTAGRSGLEARVQRLGQRLVDTRYFRTSLRHALNLFAMCALPARPFASEALELRAEAAGKAGHAGTLADNVVNLLVELWIRSGEVFEQFEEGIRASIDWVGGKKGRSRDGRCRSAEPSQAGGQVVQIINCDNLASVVVVLLIVERSDTSTGAENEKGESMHNASCRGLGVQVLM